MIYHHNIAHNILDVAQLGLLASIAHVLVECWAEVDWVVGWSQLWYTAGMGHVVIIEDEDGF